MTQRDGKEPSAARPFSSKRLLPPFAALRAFEAVGQFGGIRRAALDLGIDHAAVSRHLRALEEWAGVKLIDRDRGGRLTAEGARYHSRISAAMDDISKATMDLTRRHDDNRLVIWCIPGFAYRWLNGRLGEFALANPEIDIEVRPTDQSPDFGWHEADADIRYLRDFSSPAAADIEMLEFARPSVIAVASPAYAAEIGDGAPVASLLTKTLLHEDDDAEWRTWFAAHGISTPERLGGPRLWHAHLTLDAARRGQGVVLTNAMLLGDDLKSGDLVELRLEPVEPRICFGGYAFRARRDRWRQPAIVRFRRWLERAAEAETEGRGAD